MLHFLCVLQEAPFVGLSLIGTVNDSTTFFAQQCKCSAFFFHFYDLRSVKYGCNV